MVFRCVQHLPWYVQMVLSPPSDIPMVLRRESWVLPRPQGRGCYPQGMQMVFISASLGHAVGFELSVQSSSLGHADGLDLSVRGLLL